MNTPKQPLCFSYRNAEERRAEADIDALLRRIGSTQYSVLTLDS